MSFKDEMIANLKTPKQVLQEIEKAEEIRIKKIAESDFSLMKRALMERVSKGFYIDYGEYKVVMTEIQPNIKEFCKINSSSSTVKRGLFSTYIATYTTFLVIIIILGL